LKAVCCCKNKAVQVTCSSSGGGGGDGGGGGGDGGDGVDGGVDRNDCLMMMLTRSQSVVQQAMGQVMGLLLQCSVLTADQQQEIYADTDTLLDEECV
jgi:hypothetical protein